MYGSCGCDSNKCCPYTQKGVKFGFAFGISNAIFMMLIAWIAGATGHGTTFVANAANLYHGYSTTLEGGLVGAFWGLVVGFLYGFVFGVVLKCCSRCCGRCSGGDKSSSSSCSMPSGRK